MSTNGLALHDQTHTVLRSSLRARLAPQAIVQFLRIADLQLATSVTFNVCSDADFQHMVLHARDLTLQNYLR